MLESVEHIAMAVADLDAALAHYEKAWGLRPDHRETVADQGVEEAMLPLGGTYLQLLAPLGPDTMVGKFLDTRGEGLHHIAYLVGDIESELESLRASGVQLIDETPRAGSRNTKVAFVHPKGNLGLLVELVEHP